MKVKGNWMWTAEIDNGSVKPIRATGELYPGNNKGLKEAKRDAASAIEHLREKGNIKVKRS